MAGKPADLRPAGIRDRLGRSLRDLRISVMDQCNFRCGYCMPEETYPEDYRFLSSAERLGFDEIMRVIRASLPLGVEKIRLTGGEPLLRQGLTDLIAEIASCPQIGDIALTTNGALLARQAEKLRKAGLSRLSVSVDALDPVLFRRISGGRGDISRVLEGIDAALQAGFEGRIKINMVVQKGVNEDQILSMAAYFRARGIPLRFIEFMDVGTCNGWRTEKVVPSPVIRRMLEEKWGLEPVAPHYRGEVAARWRYLDGHGEVGFISSVSAPFCGDCSRMRLSSDGRLYTCLFASCGTDVRDFMRCGRNAETALVSRLQGIWEKREDAYSLRRESLREQLPEKRRDPALHPVIRRVEMNYIGG